MTYDYFSHREPHVVESVNGKSGVITIKGSDSMLVEKKNDGSLQLKVHPSIVGGLGGGDLSDKVDKTRNEETDTYNSTTIIDNNPNGFSFLSTHDNKGSYTYTSAYIYCNA